MLEKDDLEAPVIDRWIVSAENKELTKQPLAVVIRQRHAEDEPNLDFPPTPVVSVRPADHEAASSASAAHVRVEPENLEDPFNEPPVNTIEVPGVTPVARMALGDRSRGMYPGRCSP
jgi:hypothetical protein